MTSCCARDYERVFGRKTAARDARRFRRRGLRGSSKAAAELAGDVRGATVLEVGGGVGAIEIALLEHGAKSATNVELAATYEDAARRLLSERDLAARVDRRIGDFVAEADAIPTHDVVLMHRVVCCYPDVEALVGAGAAHARARMVLTYPQERRAIRAAIAAIDAVMRVAGSTFQVYVHPVDRIAAAAHGMQLVERRRSGYVWETAVFATSGR
ncbi:MAG: SAM-dependent methyltransferase [Acidobacteriota bacterium]|nr:SAM-dependent methyltransferase [Acidobacteriota bacterium]